MKLIYSVEKKDNAKPLNRVLSDSFGLSGLLIKKIRLYGQARVNGNHHRMIDPVYTGDEIVLLYDEPKKKEPEKIKSRNGINVIYSDMHLLVLSKPSGIVTHHAANHQSGTLMDSFPELKLHPVSRLDRETSGIIVFARNPHAHYRLSVQHREKTMIKEYTGINHGIFPFPEGKINAPIKRKPDSIMLRTVSPDGHPAITYFKNIKTFPKIDTSINKFILETGRTHQIRVHSLFCRNPIIGDGLYGALSNDNRHYQKSSHLDKYIKRQALHATYISFKHPITNRTLEFRDEISDDMADLIAVMEK